MPTDPNILYNLEHEIRSAGVIDPVEMRVAVEALLSGTATNQNLIYANLGLDLGDADKVWMDQQWTTVLADDVMREIALNNDKTQFEIALEHKAKDMIVERHEANGMLFDTFFSNPEFQGRLLEFLGGTYEEFRAGARLRSEPPNCSPMDQGEDIRDRAHVDLWNTDSDGSATKASHNAPRRQRMAWTQLIGLVGKAAPVLAKQIPKLWPLLLETKNRQKLVDVGKDLASQSPKRRIEGRIKVTAMLADTVGAKATDEDEREMAEDWARRARNLTIRLDMPVHDRKTRKSHRASVQTQLDELQTEMNEHLER